MVFFGVVCILFCIDTDMCDLGMAFGADWRKSFGSGHSVVVEEYGYIHFGFLVPDVRFILSLSHTVAL